MEPQGHARKSRHFGAEGLAPQQPSGKIAFARQFLPGAYCFGVSPRQTASDRRGLDFSPPSGILENQQQE
jgi:hypothetical protein